MSDWVGRLRLLAVGLVLLIGSCAEPKPPYADLNEGSYGPLARRTPVPCDPDQQGPINDLSLNITALVARPFQSLNKVDQSLVDEGLANKFKFPGDPGGFTVAIITHDDDHVLFWYMLDLVKPAEVDAAATQFCMNRERATRWVGLAQQCAPASPAPFAINGQQKMMRPTYVLSEYECPAPSLGPSRRARSHRPTARP